MKLLFTPGKHNEEQISYLIFIHMAQRHTYIGRCGYGDTLCLCVCGVCVSKAPSQIYTSFTDFLGV